jgi:hypothetical protein
VLGRRSLGGGVLERGAGRGACLGVRGRRPASTHDDKKHGKDKAQERIRHARFWGNRSALGETERLLRKPLDFQNFHLHEIFSTQYFKFLISILIKNLEMESIF